MKDKNSPKTPADRLTGSKRLFVDFLSDPDNHETPEVFAKKINVDMAMLNKWKTDPIIVQAAFHMSVTRLGAEIPRVLNMLLQKALEDKDVSACKLFFQQLDKTADFPEAGLSVDEALVMIDRAVQKLKNKTKSI
ncbi:hypothetical protein ACFL6I_09400 [candidate division KSB1 bacterium]